MRTSRTRLSQSLASRLHADLQAVAIKLHPLPLRQQLPRHVQLAQAPEGPQALNARKAVALQVQLLEAVQLLQAAQGGDVVVLQAPRRGGLPRVLVLGFQVLFLGGWGRPGNTAMCVSGSRQS